MRTYGLYGLRLASAFPLGLKEVEGTPDVVLISGPVAGGSGTERNGSPYDQIFQEWKTVACIRVRSGSEIVIDPCTGADPEFLRAIVMGPALNLILLQRGLFPLHASAVTVAGKAVAIAADSGVGKSTLAAALVSRGHGFLSDDVAAIRFDPDQLRVVPGRPKIRLSLGSCDRLGLDGALLPRAFSLDEEKRELPVEGRFVAEATPLERIYLLRDQPTGQVTIAPPQRTFREILGLCHGMNLPLRPITASVWMERAARITSQVPVFYLDRSNSLDSVEDVANRIEDHLRSSARSGRTA